MKPENDPRPEDEIQLEQLAQELETPEGRKRLADDAYDEAMAAEKRRSILGGLIDEGDQSRHRLPVDEDAIPKQLRSEPDA